MFARRIVLKLVLLCASLLAPVLVAEVYLRWVEPVAFRAPQPRIAGDMWREVVHVASPIPGLAYELAAHRSLFAQGAAISTNAHGMRSFELLSRRPGRLRVGVLGDSYTFGFGVGMHETFVAHAERLLNEQYEPGREYEFLNCGVGGYSSQDEALLLEHRVLPLDPDLVLVAYSLNDPEIDPVQPVHAYYQEVAWWQHVHLLRLVAATRFDWDIQRFGGGDYIRYLHRDPRKWESVGRAFAHMQAAATDARVPLAILIFPHNNVGDWHAYRYRAEHAQVAARARGLGIPVLDLLPAFQAGGAAVSLRIAEGDDHPNARGHEIAGRALRDWLRQGLLPRAEQPLPAWQRSPAPPLL